MVDEAPVPPRPPGPLPPSPPAGKPPPAPRGLGRGLSALLSEGEPQPGGEDADFSGRSRLLPVAFLKPNRFQPRRFFDAGELKELADSIKEKGVLQPILVRPTETRDS